MLANFQALSRRCVCLCVSLVVASFSVTAAAQVARKPVAAVTPAFPSQTVDLGVLPAAQPISNITIALRLPDDRADGLKQFLSDVTTPGNASYHHWLTPQEFAERFGAKDADVNSTRAWVEAQGLHVDAVNVAHTLLTVSGTAVNVEHAFVVDLRKIQVDGVQHFANVTAPTVSPDVASLVAGVSGLNDLTSAKASTLVAASTAVDANAAPLLSLTGLPAGDAQWQALISQANAQGITVLADTSATYSGVTVISPSVLPDALTPAEMRPTWQVALGLPADNMRAVPDFVSAGDFSATVNQLVALTGGRLGNINDTLYRLAPIPNVFTLPDDVTPGTWQAAIGLGTINPDEVIKHWPLGTVASTTIVTVNLIPATHGATITLTSAVTSQTGGGALPTGTVTFSSEKGTVGTANLDSSGKANFATNQLDSGSYNFTATYNGDSTYAGSVSATPAATTILNETATPVGALVGTATNGQNATIEVTVRGTSGVGYPSGAISIQPQGGTTYTGTAGATSTPGVASGRIGFPVTQSTPFTVLVSCAPTANYTCYTPSSLTVTPGASGGTTATNTSITASPFSVVHGSNLTLTATVASQTGGATPTGSITFSSSVTGTIGTGVLDGSGKATFTTNQLTAGSYSFNAAYSGDGTYAASTSPVPVTVSVQAEPATVSAVVNGTPANGSVSSIVVTVAAPSGIGFPAGVVSAQGQGISNTTTYSATLTSSATAGKSTATISYPVSQSSAFTVLVSCTPSDNNFTCSTPYSLQITPGVGKGASTTTLTSSPNPPVTGAATTFTATVASGSTSVTTTPTGTVNFQDNGNPIGTGTLTGGVATFTTTLTAGTTHVINAVYAGDTNYNSSTSGSLSTSASGTKSTNTSITSSNFSPTHGANVTLTATVTSQTGGATPTGTVTFTSSATGTVGTGTLDSSGKATYTTNQLNGGSYSFNAVYSGDSTYATSTSPAPVTISIQPEVASVSAILNGTASYGSNASVVVTVTGTSGVGVPTGTVKAQGQGTTDTTAYPGTLAASGTAGKATATISYPVSEKNTFTLLISCTSGDTNFTCPTPYSLSVTPGASKTASTTTLTSSPNPPVTGAATTFTATVASGSTSVTTVATGTVSFLDGGVAIGSGTLSAGKASFTTTLTAGTVHTITAVYSGDTVYNTSTSGVLSTSAGTTTSAVTLTSSPNPPVAGQSVTFTATVTSPTGASIPGRVSPLATTPTGTVTFMDNGTALSSSTLDSTGKATLTTVLAAGTAHSVTAAYSGNGTFAVSTSPAITVSANATGTTATTTSLVASSYAVTAGTNITFTSVVKTSATSTSSPTGTVTLTDSKDGVIGTGTIGSDGTVNISSTTLSSGTHNITATYSGDANFAASSSSAIIVTISPAVGTLTASISPRSVAYGYQATITATVAVTSGAANGTIQATLDGQTYTGTMTAGTASITVNAPKPGTYSVVVSCPTANSFTCSNTVTLSLTVTKGSTTTSLTSNVSSAQAGDSITLTATIANQGNGTGTYTFSGTVTFLDAGRSVGTATVTGNTASASVKLTGAGTHALTAVYSGDTNWFGSTSSAISVVTTQIETTLVLSAPVTTALRGANVIFTATAGNGGISTIAPPSGTVIFYDTFGSTVINLGSAVLVSNGPYQSIAQFSTTGLQPGTHSIYAVYAGDGNYKTATSNSYALTISDFTASFNPSQLTIRQGNTGQIAVTVTPSGGFTGTVSLGCVPPPDALMTCSFSPTTVNTTGTSVLTVTTTANKAALENVFPWKIPAGGAVVASLLCLLLPRRRRLGALLMVVLGVAALTASGCASGVLQDNSNNGGNTGGGTTNNGTPFGTLSLTVTLQGSDGLTTSRRSYTYPVTVQ